MKKILFIILCSFMFMKISNASTLESYDLPYYVKINDEIINVKFIYDTEMYEAVFSANYQNYDITNNFTKYREVNSNNYGEFYKNVETFNNIVYYDYLLEPSEINYYITQAIIWSLNLDTSVSLVDEFGNVIPEYTELYKTLYKKAHNHLAYSTFMYKTHNVEIWTTTELKYADNTVILDNPIIDGLKLTTKKNILKIDNLKVGNYTIELYKDYLNESYSYNDGVNIYWQNLGGPTDIYKSVKYNVYGTKLNIIENLNGINNKFGDAINNSEYNLYLDDELKLTTNDLSNVYVKSNSNYKLISTNNSIGYLSTQDIEFSVLNEEYTIYIDKYVISKNISLNILDNNDYYIYLKSNNELYGIVNTNNNLISLPYGTYYIKDINDTYYQEITIDNNIDEVLTIENNSNLEDDNTNEDNINNNDKENNDSLEGNKEEIKDNPSIEEKPNESEEDKVNDSIDNKDNNTSEENNSNTTEKDNDNNSNTTDEDKDNNINNTPSVDNNDDINNSLDNNIDNSTEKNDSIINNQPIENNNSNITEEVDKDTSIKNEILDIEDDKNNIKEEIKNELNYNSQEELINNPKTSDKIDIYIILFIISIILIINFIFKKVS